jgi:flagellar basal body rod protein FlgG
MQAASLQLDVAANDVANLATAGFRPTLGGLVEDMVALVQAPILYAANARVVGAADEATASLLDALA